MIIPIAMIVALLACPKAIAADNSLSVCLDTATKLEARGKVDDKDLIAAQQACKLATEGARDAATRTKVSVATTTIVDEYRRRAGSSRSH
jgi:hypothetical protein